MGKSATGGHKRTSVAWGVIAGAAVVASCNLVPQPAPPDHNDSLGGATGSNTTAGNGSGGEAANPTIGSSSSGASSGATLTESADASPLSTPDYGVDGSPTKAEGGDDETRDSALPDSAMPDSATHDAMLPDACGDAAETDAESLGD